MLCSSADVMISGSFELTLLLNNTLFVLISPILYTTYVYVSCCTNTSSNGCGEIKAHN